MIVLISPAKTMAATFPTKAISGTIPSFLKEAGKIAMHMTQFSPEEIGKVLKVNSKLGAENYMRFRDFYSTETHPLPSIFAYTGIVFKNIHPEDFTPADFEFAQDHLRVASFCYGLLCPLDLIKPYRMEFDVRLPEFGEGNMYDFWKKKLNPVLLKTIKASEGILIYLGSMEMQPLFDWKKIEKSVRVITPDFKVWKNGKPKTIVVYAKMARGQMARYIIKNQINDPEDLKLFSWEGFTYNEALSKGDNWVFIQEG